MQRGSYRPRETVDESFRPLAEPVGDRGSNARHRVLEGDSRTEESREIDGLEGGSEVGSGRTDHGYHGHTGLLGELRHPADHLAFERRCVQPAFPRDHNVSRFDSLIQVHLVGDEGEPVDELASQRCQSAPQTTCGARPVERRYVHAKFIEIHLGQSIEASLQQLDLSWRSSLLRSKYFGSVNEPGANIAHNEKLNPSQPRPRREGPNRSQATISGCRAANPYKNATSSRLDGLGDQLAGARRRGIHGIVPFTTSDQLQPRSERHFDHRDLVAQAPGSYDGVAERTGNRRLTVGPTQSQKRSLTTIGHRSEISGEAKLTDRSPNRLGYGNRGSGALELVGSGDDMHRRRSSQDYRAGVAEPIVLVSNRGPLSFSIEDGKPVARRGAGGLVSGLAPLVADTDATWIACALSDGDRLAAAEGVIEAEGLRVRTLAIEADTLRQAYDVVCNATLWFAYHGLFDMSRRPLIDDNWRKAWDSYREFNRQFADVVAQEAPPNARVLIQDYHLALMGPILRAVRPDVTSIHFSHTPFAPPIMMRLLPSFAAEELLNGMAANHACGFHSDRWAADFRASCADVSGVEPNTFVSPLAPDADDIRSAAASAACEAAVAELDSREPRRSIVRVDRIELSKNILRGFRSFDLLLERRADLRGEVVFRALGYPSREGLSDYLAYRQEVEGLADVINRRWGTSTWNPIELDLVDDYPRSVAALRRYDVLFVNPIRDGLNLVALEGPLVNERNGVVVVSREAGVWDQLDGAALGVNPYDIGEQAQALARALDMKPKERADHSRTIRDRAEARTPRDWLADQLSAF